MTPPRPLEAAFEQRRAAGSSALIPYLTAGFPGPDASLEALIAVADAGADIIELGIPFSDPLADGPVIQQASHEALQRGMTVPGALDLLRRFRSERATPVVVFSYLNPILSAGLAEFVRSAAAAGADGLLITDLPVGADAEAEAELAGSGLDLIRLVAPTTSPERIREIAEVARGFIYYISRTGVTGVQSELRAGLEREVDALKAIVRLPVAVGFGISTPDHARTVASVADGVVVGSALVRVLGEQGADAAGRFVGSLRSAIDDASGAPPR